MFSIGGLQDGSGYFGKLLGRSHLNMNRVSEFLFSLIFYQIEVCSV